MSMYEFLLDYLGLVVFSGCMKILCQNLEDNWKRGALVVKGDVRKTSVKKSFWKTTTQRQVQTPHPKSTTHGALMGGHPRWIGGGGLNAVVSTLIVEKKRSESLGRIEAALCGLPAIVGMALRTIPTISCPLHGL